MPASVRAAVVLPEVARSANELSSLLTSVAGFPGAGEVAGLRGAVAAQLGFDPLDREALERAGVDPARGAAFAFLDTPSPSSLLVIPVANGPAVEALLARLARDRLGAETRTASARGGASVVTFRRGPDGPPALSYALVERYALVGAGSPGMEAVASSTALPTEASLANSPPFTAAMRALGDGEALVAFLPTSKSGQLLSALKDGAAVALSAEKERVLLRLAVLLGDRAPSFASLIGSGEAKKLVERLAPSAPLVARWDGNPAALGARIVSLLPKEGRDALSARGLDLDRDVFAILLPGSAASFSLAPTFTMSELSVDLLVSDAPRAVEMELVTPVTAAASEAALHWGKFADPKSPPHPSGDGRVHVRTPSGEIGWRIAGGRLALACGRPGRLEALLERLDGKGEGWKSPETASTLGLSGGLGGFVLNVPALAGAVSNLPASAFGTGPTGFIVRSALERFLGPARRILAVEARAELKSGVLLFEVEALAQLAEQGRTP